MMIYLKSTIAVSPTLTPPWEECALLTAVTPD